MEVGSTKYRVLSICRFQCMTDAHHKLRGFLVLGSLAGFLGSMHTCVAEWTDREGRQMSPIYISARMKPSETRTYFPKQSYIGVSRHATNAAEVL